MFTPKRITLLGTAGLAALVLLVTLITGVSCPGNGYTHPRSGAADDADGHTRRPYARHGPGHRDDADAGHEAGHSRHGSPDFNHADERDGRRMCDMMQTMMKGMMPSGAPLTSTMPMTATGGMCDMMQTMMKNMMPGMMASMMSGQGMMSAGQSGMSGMMGMMGGERYDARRDDGARWHARHNGRPRYDAWRDDGARWYARHDGRPGHDAWRSWGEMACPA